MHGDEPPQDGYPPTAYGPPPGHGTPGWYQSPVPPWDLPLPSRSWPHGPDRPAVAIAAAVLGFVTGGLTLFVSLVLLVALVELPRLALGLLLLGVPCAAGMIAGGVQVLRRRSFRLLFRSASAAAAVLLLVVAVGVATLSSDDVGQLVAFVVSAAPLPVVTACLSRQRTVVGWLAAGPPAG